MKYLTDDEKKRAAELKEVPIGGDLILRLHGEDQIVKLQRRTPSGRLIVHEIEYDPTGPARGHFVGHLYPVTRGALDGIERKRLADKLLRVNWRQPKYTLSQLQAIAAIEAESDGRPIARDQDC